MEMRVGFNTSAGLNPEMLRDGIAIALNVTVGQISDVAIRGGNNRRLQSGPVELDVSYVLSVPIGVTANELSERAQQLAVGGSVAQSAFQRRLLDTSGVAANNIGILTARIFLDDKVKTPPPPPPPPPPASGKTFFPSVSLEPPYIQGEPLSTNSYSVAAPSTLIVLVGAVLTLLVCCACLCKARDQRKRGKIAGDPDSKSEAEAKAKGFADLINAPDVCDADLESGAKVAPGSVMDLLPQSLLNVDPIKFAEKAQTSVVDACLEQLHVLRQSKEEKDLLHDANVKVDAVNEECRDLLKGTKNLRDIASLIEKRPGAEETEEMREERRQRNQMLLMEFRETKNALRAQAEAWRLQSRDSLADSEQRVTNIVNLANRASVRDKTLHAVAETGRKLLPRKRFIKHDGLSQLHDANVRAQALDAECRSLLTEGRSLKEITALLEERPFTGESKEAAAERRRRNHELLVEFKATKKALRAQAGSWKQRSMEAFADSDEKSTAIKRGFGQTPRARTRSKRTPVEHASLDQLHDTNVRTEAVNAGCRDLAVDARRLREISALLQEKPLAGETEEEAEERRQRNQMLRIEFKATKKSLRAQAEAWKTRSREAFVDAEEKVTSLSDRAYTPAKKERRCSPGEEILRDEDAILDQLHLLRHASEKTDQLHDANVQVEAVNAECRDLAVNATKRLHEIAALLEERPLTGETEEAREARRRRNQVVLAEFNTTKRELRAQVAAWKMRSKEAFVDTEEKLTTITQLANSACERDSRMKAVVKEGWRCLPGEQMSKDEDDSFDQLHLLRHASETKDQLHDANVRMEAVNVECRGLTLDAGRLREITALLEEKPPPGESQERREERRRRNQVLLVEFKALKKALRVQTDALKLRSIETLSDSDDMANFACVRGKT
jgi:hypothetical protein